MEAKKPSIMTSTTTTPPSFSCCGFTFFYNIMFEKKVKIAVIKKAKVSFFIGATRPVGWKHPCSSVLSVEDYFSIIEAEIPFEIQDYDEISVIRKGFSVVTKVQDSNGCIKVLKESSLEEIHNEYQVIKHLGKHPLINEVLLPIITFNGNALVFDLYDTDFYDEQNLPSANDCLLFFRCLFEALAFCHSKGIIHGDVKPGNILFHSATKSFKLIDWGSSLFCIKDRNLVRSFVGTTEFISPEIFLHREPIDYQADIWSSAVMFIYLYFGKRNIFCINSEMSNQDCVGAIIYMIGIKSFSFTKDFHLLKQMFPYDGVDFCELLESCVRGEVDGNVMDFISSILVADPSKRLTSEECLHHPLLRSITSIIPGEQRERLHSEVEDEKKLEFVDDDI